MSILQQFVTVQLQKEVFMSGMLSFPNIFVG